MYQKAGKGWAKHADFIILDLICLYISFYVAYFLRHGHLLSMQNILYRNTLIVFFFVQICVSYINDSFKKIIRRGYYQEAVATARHVVLIMLVMTAYFFITHEGDAYSRLTLFYTGILYFLSSYVARILWKIHLGSKNTDDAVRSLLLISTADKAEASIASLKENNTASLRFSGVILLNNTQDGKFDTLNSDKVKTGDGEENNNSGTGVTEEVGGIPVVADAASMMDYLSQEWVDEVFLDSVIEGENYQKLLNQLVDMGITVHTKLWEETELTGMKQTVERMGTVTVLTSSINMMSWQQSFIKRCMDIAGGLAGCMITAVLFVFIAPMIYIASPGPIFFKQVRVGKNGRKFNLYKFRSMVPDAEQKKQELSEQNRVKDGMMFKMDNDPRIIGGAHGIGSFIRRYSIDEFPQFLNVLKGDMSLVGTRPPTVDEWEKYNLHYRSRLAIKPGITGMWQTSGRSNITDFDEIVELDRYYISNWSFGLDIKILLKTIQVVFKKEGSI